MIVYCWECGEKIETQSPTKKYCADCAKRRKLAQDHALWVAKKYRMETKRLNAENVSKREILRIEKEYAKQLGLNDYYFKLFKNIHRKKYFNYLKTKLSKLNNDEK